MEDLEQRIVQYEKELREPAAFFIREGIRHTIVFFGSARIQPPGAPQSAIDKLQNHYEGKVMQSEHDFAQLDYISHEVYMSRFYAAAQELAYRLASWSQETLPPDKQHLITTGGGPGIMEAANKGASLAGARTLGITIDIPGEQDPNAYLTPGLCLHFETFAMRKFWLMYHARALIIFPGGIGTLDEFFEIYTLMKTRKARRFLPIVLYGREYWQALINFDTLVRFNTLDQESVDFLHYSDDIDDAFDTITGELLGHFKSSHSRG